MRLAPFLYVLLLPCFLFATAPKVEVFVRHCHYSSVSQHKNRPAWFSREVCNNNLIGTIDRDFVQVTYFLDAYHPIEGVHFVKRQTKYPVVEVREGSEAGAFLRLIDHIASLNLDPETIVYIVEDDYMHREGWVDILVEGFTVPEVSYVTLYDHNDKYFYSMYDTLQSKLFHTKSCHWRVTPSTTNTYAMKYKTLMRDLDLHRQFSLNTTVTADHWKFCALGEAGKFLISPIPGWSTHLEPEYMSPCIDWEAVHNAYK